MTVSLQTVSEDAGRIRRTHKKSRLGCRNCKLRRVKCDETRPKCQKCTSFGVSCNFEPGSSDLQITMSGTATAVVIKPKRKPTYSTNQFMLRTSESPDFLCPGIISDNFTAFEICKESWDRLDRFRARTVLSLGPPEAVEIYARETPRFACSYPPLMHVVQTLTAIHDRYLSGPFNGRPTVAEVYHFSQSINSFKRMLSKRIAVHPQDRDAFWATGMLLGIIAFALVEASMPEEAWPLKRAAPSDLEWIQMCHSKKTVWRISKPLGPGSVFYSLLTLEQQAQCLFPGTPKKGVDGIPPAFLKLYDLDSSSTAETNPYHSAVHSLAGLLAIECNSTTSFHFFSFISHMPPHCQRLLELKDPRALLLMAYWYAMVCKSYWWISWRAGLEGQATCIYLERYHADELEIVQLLRFPKMRLGLLE